MAKEMDRLTRNVLAAEAAGMSYGKYMALQHEQSQKAAAAPPAPAKKAGPARKKSALICVQCGAHFIGGTPIRKYCSAQCKEKHKREQSIKRKEEEL